jgi:uncharacterized protein with von Willebrand factor type A (vWA) domain
VNLGDRDDVYHTCRSLLVHRHEQLAVFDRVFEAFWRDHRGGADEKPSPPKRSGGISTTVQEVLSDLSEPIAEETGTIPADIARKAWSDVETLATKDFAAFTAHELDQARTALSRLVWSPGHRRTRRWIPGHGPRIDLRRSISRSLDTGGEVARLSRLKRRIRPRPLVLLCDVSGSMEQYSRMLLHFAHALTWRHHRVEAFLFSTQLTRITRQLRFRRPDSAIDAVSRSVPDWSGGTRIGAAVKHLHQRWGRRVLNGGPVVLIVSDGWDRGDPAELGQQIARLQRSSRRLIWLNPLIGTADYAPLTRGLQAALPFVDDFLPARTLTNLADLAEHLNGLS